MRCSRTDSLRHHRRLCALALSLAACTGASPGSGLDAGPPDARPADAAVSDARSAVDGAPLDGAPLDDASAVGDAATPRDAGGPPSNPMCTGSASGQSPVWSCVADKSARQRCINGNVETDPCAHGCVAMPVGTDDVCAMACMGSASGSSSVWTCTADRSARQQCVGGNVNTQPCAHGCVSQPSNADDYCAPDCTASASGSSPIWTCTADKTARQHCLNGGTVTEACPMGCVYQGVGVDDVCGMGCGASASGTSPIWTCTSDHTARQQCQNGVVNTEQCAHGCITQPVGQDDFCAADCSASASGTSSVWTCTADHSARQQCQNGVVKTETCQYGCTTMPVGADDTCNGSAPPSGVVNCGYPQWWNAGFAWDPGYYQISPAAFGYYWDNDLALPAWSPVQLRHASRLEREGVYSFGWMPQFTDMVTGEAFALIHLQPSQRLTTSVGAVYPAGTLVGYSGGNTTETGYCVPVPGCGPADCSTATCVFSTGAHLCVETVDSFRVAFPVGTEPCQ